MGQVVLVRMCADGAKPPAQRFAYPNALVGLFRTVSEEGPRVLGRGLSANVARSVLMSQLSSSLPRKSPALGQIFETDK
jgi:dicarboxylate transporter 10